MKNGNIEEILNETKETLKDILIPLRLSKRFTRGIDSEKEPGLSKKMFIGGIAVQGVVYAPILYGIGELIRYFY